MKLAKRRFTQRKIQAAKRGISFQLTFDEWYQWWLANGIDKDQPIAGGKKRPQKFELCMCRYNDTGPYTLNNIYCATRSQNSIDNFVNRPGMRWGKKIKTPMGIFPSLTHAARAYGLDKTTIGHRLRAYPQEYYYL